MSVNVNIYMYVCIYFNRPPEAKCDTRLIFKRNKAGMNPEFSLSWTACLIKAKKKHYYLTIAERRTAMVDDLNKNR